MATYQQSTGKSIDEAFKIFHEQNPKVYEIFKQQTLKAITLGRKKISSKQLLGYIRWRVFMSTKSNDGFKINDAFTSRYSRLFVKEFPQHHDIFNYRELRTKDARENDPIPHFETEY